jgi:CelD/BcsL family acetyltransferase involved in cellulose biosynthesis
LLNPAIIALNRLPNVFYSIISIDQKMAGFCAGFTSADGCTSIPFLAIDSRFSQYSPGGLLITETIRQLINQGRVTSLDLARGDEQYKFTYGGAEHTNYSYDIALALPGQ